VKKIVTALTILLFSVVSFAQQAEKTITCHVKDVSFDEFCKTVSTQSGIKIYYQQKWVNTLKVSFDKDNISAQQAVEEALKGTSLGVSRWHGDLVVMPGERLLSTLPAYNFKTKSDSVNELGQGIKTQAEERYIAGRRGDVPLTIRIGKKNTPVTGGKAKITCHVLDEENSAPIFSATFFITETKTGAVSDLNGIVSLSLKPGTYNAVIEYMGYEKKKYQLEVFSDGEFTVSMNKAVIEMKELVIYGDRQMNMRSKDPGLEKMTIKAIKELPMLMGERDILKVSATLPGIVSIGEGSAGLNVRGGGSDQNAFYINKVPIYNSSHLFGFFPAFNADIIKDFSIYKGHIPAQYGGHLSSVFNIITRQGNRKHFTARGGISPITANIVVEGPLKKEVSSVMLSARSSYSDWILKKINDQDIQNSSAQFNDLSGNLNYDFKKTQISAFAYHSFDSFRYSDLTSYQYSNNGASTSIGHNFGSLLRCEFSLIASQYTFSTTDKQEASTAYQHDYELNHYEAKLDFKHMLSEKNSLEYGLNSILYKLDRGKVVPYGDESYHKSIDLGKEQGLESSVYISDLYDVTPWLNLTAGIRYALFMPVGPKTVYKYLPDEPMNIRNITDTLTFGDNEPIAKYHEPDVRVAVNLKTDDAGSVKLAFNQMHQNLFMLNTTTAIAPNTQWKLADYHLLPSESNQYSAGVFRTLSKLGLEASTEVFYKQTRNFPEFKDGADFLNNPIVETAVLQGDQKAWGIEVYLKRSMRKLEGWLSYTYSRSLITVDGGEEWNQINGGETYPANFDIPHSLNLVASYHITRRLTLATIVTYQTGKPVTYPVSVYFVDRLPVLDYSKRNAYRIPDYFRTDFSLTVEGNLKKQKFLHSSLILSLYNAFGRDNPYSVYYTVEDGNIRSYQYSVIGVPVFTATWLFKLGNYAAE
jgi:hypothetical protein